MDESYLAVVFADLWKIEFIRNPCTREQMPSVLSKVSAFIGMHSLC